MKTDLQKPLALFKKSLRAWQAEWKAQRAESHNRSETAQPSRPRARRPRRSQSMPT
jgi:hypothetical protein